MDKNKKKNKKNSVVEYSCLILRPQIDHIVFQRKGVPASRPSYAKNVGVINKKALFPKSVLDFNDSLVEVYDIASDAVPPHVTCHLYARCLSYMKSYKNGYFFPSISKFFLVLFFSSNLFPPSPYNVGVRIVLFRHLNYLKWSE